MITLLIAGLVVLYGTVVVMLLLCGVAKSIMLLFGME